MVRNSRPLHLAALTAFAAVGLLAGPASAETVADHEPVAIAEVARTPAQDTNEAAAVSLADTDSLALAAFPVALLAIAAGTVVVANGRRGA